MVSASDQWKQGLLSSMTDGVRLSYGAGLVLRLGGIARLELNHVVPVRVQANDRSVYLFVSVSVSAAVYVSVCVSDCNPEIEFSIPGSRIEKFVILGSHFVTDWSLFWYP